MLKVCAKAKVVGSRSFRADRRTGPTWQPGRRKQCPVPRCPRRRSFVGYDGNLNDATVVHNWPYPDRTRLHQLLVSNPEYFRPNTVDNFQQQLFFPQSVKEEIDSAYAAANGRWKQLRFEGGLRYELTRTKAKILEAIPGASIRATRPDLVAGTIPYILYQSHDGVRDSRYGRYENLFWNGSVKYAVKRNLNTQLSFSDAVLRPSYNNLAGRETVDETNTVTIPNSALKPETSRKYYGGVQYYFELAGTLSAGMFVLEVKDILEAAGR
jgi:iron complex outermembrane recepter protein